MLYIVFIVLAMIIAGFMGYKFSKHRTHTTSREDNLTVKDEIRTKKSNLTTSKLLSIIADRIYPKAVMESYKENIDRDDSNKTLYKGIVGNHLTKYGPLVKDMFIPMVNTYITRREGKRVYGLNEGFIPFSTVGVHLDERLKNTYGTLTYAYLSGMVANAMSRLKPEMLRLDEEGKSGKIRGRSGTYRRTDQGYYTREDRENNFTIFRGNEEDIVDKVYSLEDLIQEDVLETIDNYLEYMIKVDRENNAKCVVKNIPMKNLNASDPSDLKNIKVIDLTSRYFFNSIKTIKTKWLTEEAKEVRDAFRCDKSSIRTWEDFFKKFISGRTIFFQMYIYNYFFYRTLNTLVDRVVNYCKQQGKLTVDEDIFNQLFSFVVSGKYVANHAVKLSPDYVTSILLANEHVNSGYLIVYRTPLDMIQNSIYLAPRIKGIEYKSLDVSNNMSVEDYKPLLLFNIDKI